MQLLILSHLPTKFNREYNRIINEIYLWFDCRGKGHLSEVFNALCKNSYANTYILFKF